MSVSLLGSTIRRLVGSVVHTGRFDLAIDSKLRACDVMRLRIGQIVINASPEKRHVVPLNDLPSLRAKAA